MRFESKMTRARLMFSAATVALALSANAAMAQDVEFNIAPQSLTTALYEFGSKSTRQVMFTPDVTAAKKTAGVSGAKDEVAALEQLLVGTGLTYRANGNVLIIMPGEGGSDPQSESAAGDGADGTVEALIVTAQKREEDIQDVPIAISAFTQEDLTRSQVAGGPDLMTQVPNFTFTKTNFSGYSIQIRGIGTQAISATTDAAVAVSFNNTSFIRNRFFEQEFYDLQRVEVLRGPQGTLYGRNATAGVVNIISQKPKFNFEAKASADVANFNSTRLEGMVNIPLAEDVAALRIAGAWTKRDGYATNAITGNPIDGRDLWSTRVSLRVAPTDNLDVNLIWEHFEENDDRLRSGKQLCHRDVVTEIKGVPIDYYGPDGFDYVSPQANFSLGCKPASMYSPDSFEAPNGFSIPYYHPLGAIGLPTVHGIDPYLSTTQSRDLRVIESSVDPHYGAESDLGELQVRWDLSPTLSLTSETAYSVDSLYSTQDFNRFSTTPGMFQDHANIDPGGVFCDPQIGCTDRLTAIDVSQAKSRQFSQEFRLGSDYEGRFNFSLGANFLRYDTEDKYYVFINTLTLYAAERALLPTNYEPGVTDNYQCLRNGPVLPDLSKAQEVYGCIYIDPNPLDRVNDRGHNYFLSKNPYKLISYAAFGEAYWDITDALKLTAGIRVTRDEKTAPIIPSWLLATQTAGLPIKEVVEQKWTEPTGRVVLDWKPDLGFTDETLFFASYSHGYKAGGANPPRAGVVGYNIGFEGQLLAAEESIVHPKTFAPEFVDAFEVGTKNTLLDGALTLNASAFYYDYRDYQISQIVDRSASNLNFDATIKGLELEADWQARENLRFGLKLGYEDTRVADGEKAIDIFDRTAGDPNWMTVRPHPTQTSNCIMPMDVIYRNGQVFGTWEFVGSGGPTGCEDAYLYNLDPVTHQPYQADPFPGYAGFNPETAPNHGEGIDKDLSGNALPNAPHYTATLTTDYTAPLPQDWLMTLHSDLYYQSEAWTRIFNLEGYDKLKAYTNVNLAAIFSNEDAGWTVMAYVKNVFDRDSITGSFLNSDDTGLTTNVFLTEPRLYGLRVTKNWSGGWGGLTSPNHQPGAPYRFTVELGGQLQNWDAPYESVRPSFGDAYSGPDDTLEGPQHDYDWGDGRSVRLIYRPAAEPWMLSADYRTGVANGDDRRHGEEWLPRVCAFERAPDGSCVHISVDIPVVQSSDTQVTNKDEFKVAEFAMGRDLGFGSLSRSTLSAGLRYAHLNSNTHLDTDGRPDTHGEDNWLVTNGPMEFHRYRASLDTDRELEAVGPTFAWDAAQRLLGDDNGHVDLDWTARAGVLFGKQKTHFGGTEDATLYQVRGLAMLGLYFPPIYVAPTTHVDSGRSQSVTVPVVDLSAGLSYQFQGFRVGAGYRWERYFDAVDAGFDEHRSDDRTIDGPYFNIALSFGG